MRTIIFGVTGQDGSYLAEHLLEKGHEVIGIARRTSTPNAERLSSIISHPLFSLLAGDITDFGSVLHIIQDYPADWVINLAAQSHVGTSFQQACSSMDITAKGCINILEAVRITDNLVGSKTKVYQASSSEMFGSAVSFDYDIQGQGARYDGVYPSKDCAMYQNRYGEFCVSPEFEDDGLFQDEYTAFRPQSPYAVAKVAAHQFCRLYREAYNMDVRCGILFNHESERRGEEFVTRKITKWLGQFKAWHNPVFENIQLALIPKQDDKNRLYNSLGDSVGFPKLRLGNLDVSRDWGHAKDYVKAMTLIMEAAHAEDWVVSTGQTHTITEFLALSFELAGLGCWKNYVVIDDQLKRPAEVPFLKGDSSRIRTELGWSPEVTFNELVKRMVENDINKYRES